MDQRWFGLWVQSRVWVYAKTMPQWPHEYTSVNRKKDAPEVVEMFEVAVVYVREAGMRLRFKATGSRFTYLPFGAHMYWSMGWPPSQTVVLNRCEYVEGLPDHIPVKRRKPKGSPTQTGHGT
ncbi:hypothetical protein [Methyloceanibacter sp.]|uniref:hypothetical protein n=1 Tax=Methyloceanibacter sp. TaxID=1965321 RepID=UPI003D6D3E4F